MIESIFQLCLIPLLGILTKYIIDYLSAKRNELNTKTNDVTAQKYNNMIYETVVNCVIATNQTYVNSLKETGKFDQAAQEIAFEKTLNAVMDILSQDAIDYINEMTNDAQTYLTTIIEKEVNKNRA